MNTEEQNANAELGAVRVIMRGYMVHFKNNARTLKFEVYPVQEWEYLLTGNKRFSYIDKENEPDEREIFEEGKCLKKFEGSFCWSGVWEGRHSTGDECCEVVTPPWLAPCSMLAPCEPRCVLPATRALGLLLWVLADCVCVLCIVVVCGFPLGYSHSRISQKFQYHWFLTVCCSLA